MHIFLQNVNRKPYALYRVVSLADDLELPEPKVFKFCAQLGHIDVSQMDVVKVT